mmetsp:Transcript_29477/g.35057  ORF Transcript_29477/g.35057 Transcript_29477/m.35057 type:complete len:218 (-) Transcript_29477:8-661(-)
MISIRSSTMLNSSLLRSGLKINLRPVVAAPSSASRTGISKICGRISTISTTRRTQTCPSYRTSIMSSCSQMTKKNSMNLKKRMLTSAGDKASGSVLQRWMAPRDMPPRGTVKWYAEMVLICTVFAVTGTSTMVIVRPAISDVLGLKGNFKDGPWSYRICSLIVMTPLYSMMLVIVGTAAGRHAYFRHFAVKMFRRFGVPPELMDKNFHKNAKHFRKY